MIVVPKDVKCIVCNKIFCCTECVQKHESSSHPNVDIVELKAVANCSLCKGSPLAVLDVNKIDNLTRHLCDKHLPLRCQKCYEVAHTAEELLKMNKCTRPRASSTADSKTVNTLKGIDENSTGCEYVTAIDDGNGLLNKLTELGSEHSKSFLWQRQHSSTKTNPNLSDTVFSIRNCSSILQNSTNQSNRRSISPGEKGGKGLVRQTSTPMIKNAVIVQSPDSLTSSSIHSNSCESDGTVPSPPPPPPPMPSLSNTTHAIIGHGKGSTVQSPNRKRNSRNKMPSTATPLRHVLSKSILRAIRERAGDTPGSPLDLRLSPVIRRSYSDPVRNRTGNSKIEQLQEHAHCDLPVKSSSIVIEARPTFLATVYESAKNFQQLRSGDYETVAEGYEMAESAPHDEVDIKNMSRVGEQTALKDDAETDKPQQNADGIHGKDDIWYTPNEFPPITYNAEEHEETPMARPSRLWPNKRPAIRFIANMDRDENEPTPKPVNTSANTKSSNKWWSLISSVLKFPLKGQKNDEADDSTSFIIKRCASFTGILKRNDASKDDDENMQPNKRRRTNSASAPLNGNAINVYRRIQSRQPISRLRSDS